MNNTKRVFTGTALSAASILLFTSGCWTPPNPNAQPPGEPRLIQGGLKVDSVKEDATVQAVDAGARTLTLKLPSDLTATYKVSDRVENFGSVQVNDKVVATVTDELDIYLLKDGQLPDGKTAQKLGVNAKLIFNDPNADASYRLLTLVYPNGGKETVKVGLEAKISEMADGDSVVVRPVEVTKIKIEKP
ncbi:MAG TPA: hypothetical protein VMB80_01535 [Candidatus Acidoferrum sp.]|nr:hypothetical protein [Candidatus Acidoferrum sp.]